MRLLKSFCRISKFPSQTVVRNMVRYLKQDEAIQIDELLFNEYKFSVDQLMELAGLSCANTIVQCYPTSQRVLVCCGPGNNGGDGLVCARHLKHYGYSPTVLYPKKTNKDLYERLIHQCVSLGIEVNVAGCSPDAQELNQRFDLVVDALFGFSFKPPVRSEFEPVMTALMNTCLPICSIDIPSGWDVENGRPEGGLRPDLLVSLTAPKLCAKDFEGRYHYLGGRFVPFELAEKFKLDLPLYPGTANFVSLS